jgi:hypothetical protein
MENSNMLELQENQKNINEQDILPSEEVARSFLALLSEEVQERVFCCPRRFGCTTKNNTKEFLQDDILRDYGTLWYGVGNK